LEPGDAGSNPAPAAMDREKQKQIVKEYMEKWGEKFEIFSANINDFKIPRLRIAPNLSPAEFKKLWDELVEEIKKEKTQES
jgi:hypothetical protein